MKVDKSNTELRVNSTGELRETGHWLFTPDNEQERRVLEAACRISKKEFPSSPIKWIVAHEGRQ